MKKNIWILLLALFFSNAAYAKCESNEKTVFSCTTNRAKLIEVCDSGNILTYTFGKPNMKPEIVLKVQRTRTSTWQWDGMGRTESYVVNIPNSKTIYSVFWGKIESQSQLRPVLMLRPTTIY